MPINFRGLGFSSGGTAVLDTVLTRVGPVVDLKGWGAAVDGVTDDFNAWVSAINALPSTGGIIDIGRGTTVINEDLSLSRPNLVVRGESMFTTVVKAGVVHNTIFQGGATPNRGNLRIVDLTMDMNNVMPVGITLYPDDLTCTFERVRFINLFALGVNLNGCSNVQFIDCVFEGDGNPGGGTMVQIAQGSQKVKFTRCRFRYHNEGIIIDSNFSGTGQNEKPIGDITVDSCYFDQAWWLLRAAFSGTGGTVTYGATSLTDSSAAFTGIDASNTNVRAMPLLASGTALNADFFFNRLIDTTATFVTAGIKPGHILRAGTTFAVVKNVENETTLWVEEWLSDTTRAIKEPPYGTAYNVYGVYLGLITAFTGTTLTVNRWHDLDGFSVTPANGTRYEVMYRRPDYSLHAEQSTRDVKVVNSTFRRGWSDQISLYGFRNIVIGNTVEDGQDFGMTIHGQENVIQGNRVRHQGTQGIAHDGDDSNISDNVCTGTPWVNISAVTGEFGTGGNRNVYSNNTIRSGGLPHHRYGLLIGGFPSPTAQDNLLEGNIATGYATADIKLISINAGNQTRTRLRNNTYATIAVDANVTAMDYGELVGTGSPEGVVTASIGTVYRRLDGGASTCLYVKESGTSNTGWIAK